MKAILILLFVFAISMATNAQQAHFSPDERTLMGFLENQEYAKAAGYLKVVVASNPENMHYLSLLGYVYYMSHQLSLAESCYGKIFNRDSANATACNYLGNINLEKGNKPRALYFFCRLVDLKPGVAAYYKQLAVLWQQLNNSQAATYYYRKSYFINPNDAGVVVGLADGWVAQKMYIRADSILDVALQKDSLQRGILEERIQSAYVQEKYEVIFPLVEKLKQMEAISMKPFFYAAAGYFLTKQYKACSAMCDFMLEKKLKTRSVLYLQAMAFEKQKQYKLSLQRLEECLADALSKDAIDYFSTKGEIYEKMKAFHTAMRQYDTAYYIFKEPVMMYKKALVYDRDLKNPTTALRYYQSYLHKRHDSVPPLEMPLYKYAIDREKTLRKWKSAQTK